MSRVQSALKITSNSTECFLECLRKVALHGAFNIRICVFLALFQGIVRSVKMNIADYLLQDNEASVLEMHMLPAH